MSARAAQSEPVNTAFMIEYHVTREAVTGVVDAIRRNRTIRFPRRLITDRRAPAAPILLN